MERLGDFNLRQILDSHHTPLSPRYGVFIVLNSLLSSLILELKYKEELGDGSHISWLNDWNWMLKSSLWMEPMGTPLRMKAP